MKEVNDLIDKTKYKNINECLKKYNEMETKLNEINSNLLLSMDTVCNNENFTLREQLLLYKSVIDHNKYEEERDIHASVIKKIHEMFPRIRKYLLASSKRNILYEEKNLLLKECINFNYDNKYHIFIPYENGLKCIVTNDIIKCQTKEELDFLKLCAMKQNLYLKNYQEEDYDYVRDVLNKFEIDSTKIINRKKEKLSSKTPWIDKMFSNGLSNVVDFLNVELRNKKNKSRKLTKEEDYWD